VDVPENASDVAVQAIAQFVRYGRAAVLRREDAVETEVAEGMRHGAMLSVPVNSASVSPLSGLRADSVGPDPTADAVGYESCRPAGSQRGVWARAAAELAEAENIFVIGYSLPPSDAFFRFVHALGTVGKKTLRRFWVFNPDNTRTVRGRSESLLGHGARARFEYDPDTFSSAIKEIRKLFPRRR
jgi:hypothetical protein